MSGPSPFFLSDIAVKRPVLAVVFALLLITFGLAAVWQLPVREQPDVDPPKVSVTTVYPGASARVMDRDVTDIIEANLNGIDGVDQIVSSSRNQFSQITVEFDTGRDLDAAAADVRDRVSEVRAQLPEEVDPPVISKAAADAQAIMWITLRSDTLDRKALTDYAQRRLVDPLSVVPGVAQVVIGGARRYAMRIWLDPEGLARHGVTVQDVARALRSENVELPAGRIESDARELTVRATTKFQSAEEFEKLVLVDGEAGQVTLDQVAEVVIGAENDRSAVFVNGTPAIGLGIIRQSGSNTLAVTSGVQTELDRLRSQLPGDIVMDISYDQSIFIEGSLKQVVRTFVITVLLVLAVIYLFLGSLRATLVPAVTIPVSVIASFSVLALAGFSINTLTLLAMVIAIGLVVDDAIVVLENVTRRREEGEPKLKAGLLGAREVAFAVISTTAVLLAVLVPVLFMGGTIGRLFTEFTVALGAALFFSSVAALSIGAMIASKVVQDMRNQDNRTWLNRKVESGFGRMQSGYDRTLDGAIRHPALVGVIALGLVIVMVLIFRSLPGQLAPTEDRAVFIVPLESPEGATLDETADAVMAVEALLEPYRGEDGPVDRSIAIIGPGRVGPPRVDQALMIVKLKPWGARDISQMALVEELRPKILGLREASGVPVNPPTLVSGGFEKPLQLVISAGNFEQARGLAEQVLQKVHGDQSIQNAEIDLKPIQPQLQLEIDRRLAARQGVNVRDIAETLQAFMGGQDITDYYLRGETYEVMVRGARRFRAEPADIEQLYVRSDTGALVPLTGLVSLRTEGVSPTLPRVDRRPSATITAVPAGVTLGTALSAMEGYARDVLTGGAVLNYTGVTKDFRESSTGLYISFGLAIVVVLLVLAGLFDSFVDPIIILLSLPLALCGALIALWLAGSSLNVYSQIGLLLIIGLLAKNAILVVDFANQRRKAGYDVPDAITEAARTRFRPVLMTSIATGFGAVPLALATGPGAQGRAVLGIVIIGGIILTTLVTLLVVPVLYRLLAPLTDPPGAVERKVEDQLKTGREPS